MIRSDFNGLWKIQNMKEKRDGSSDSREELNRGDDGLCYSRGQRKRGAVSMERIVVKQGMGGRSGVGLKESPSTATIIIQIRHSGPKWIWQGMIAREGKSECDEVKDDKMRNGDLPRRTTPRG